MTHDEFVVAVEARIEWLIKEQWFGTAYVLKRGQKSRLKYIPVVTYKGEGRKPHRELRSLAYATRGEAVAAAATHIARQFAQLRRRLLLPKFGGLRLSHGLPYEVPR